MLKEILAAAERNYHRYIPSKLKDPEFERMQLSKILFFTEKATHTYDLNTKRNLCFDTTVLHLYWQQREGNFFNIELISSAGQDHALLRVPGRNAEEDIFIDPSWKQFYAPYAKNNPELFASLPEVLILKGISKVQALMAELDKQFGLDASLEAASPYFKSFELDTPRILTQKIFAKSILKRYTPDTPLAPTPLTATVYNTSLCAFSLIGKEPLTTEHSVAATA